MDRQLRQHRFVIETTRSALFQPPSDRRFWRKLAPGLERIGRHIPVFRAGGVLIAEATKQVPSPTRPGLTAAVRRPLKILEGIGQPVPEPSRRT